MSESFFSYNESSTFPLPFADVFDTRNGIVDLSKYTEDKFTGNKKIDVDFELDGNAWLDLNESYFIADVNLYADGNAAARPANLFFAYNPLAAAFSNTKHAINNVVVDESNEILITESAYYRSTYGKTYRSEHLGAMFLGDAASRSANTGPTTRVNHTLIWKPTCLSTFRTGMLIPPAKHRLTLNISSTWKSDMIQGNDIAHFLATYHIVIKDLRFEFKYLTGKLRPEHPIYFPLQAYNISYRDLYRSTDQNHQFTIPPNTHRIMFFLQQLNIPYQSKYGYSKSNFACNTTANPAQAASNEHLKLRSFYIRNGERTIPDIPLRFDLVNKTGRVYKETCNALLKTDEWESYEDWLKEPLYAVSFPHADEPTLTNTQMILTLNFGDNVNLDQMRIVVICEHKSTMTLSYSDKPTLEVFVE